MAVTLSVGLQKKVGLPDYGSLGASCHVEFEVDRSLLDSNLDGFHQKVRFSVSRPEELSIADASGLIDELKGPAESHGGGR